MRLKTKLAPRKLVDWAFVGKEKEEGRWHLDFVIFDDPRSTAPPPPRRRLASTHSLDVLHFFKSLPNYTPRLRPAAAPSATLFSLNVFPSLQLLTARAPLPRFRPASAPRLLAHWTFFRLLIVDGPSSPSPSTPPPPPRTRPLVFDWTFSCGRIQDPPLRRLRPLTLIGRSVLFQIDIFQSHRFAALKKIKIF